MKRHFSALLAIAITAAMSTRSPAEDPKPAVGDEAPAFETTDHDGSALNSTTLYAEGATLLFFYPKAGTGG